MTFSIGPRAGVLAALPAPPGIRVILLLALAKACLGVLALAPGALLSPPFRTAAWGQLYLAGLLALFTVTGGALLLGGRRNRRSLYWGGALALVAEPLAGAPLMRLAEGLPHGVSRSGLALTAGVSLEVFLPAFLWVFALHFHVPRDAMDRRRARSLARGARICWYGGILLLLLQALSLVSSGREGLFGALSLLTSRHELGSLYYPMIAAAALPVLGYLALELRRRGRPERIFLIGVVLGLGPVTIGALLRPLLASIGALHPWILIAVAGPLLAVPLVTAWAVAAHQLFDVHRIAVREVQYSALRGGLTALAAVPIALLVAYAYQERHRTLAELLAPGPFLALLLLAAAAVAVLGARRPILATAERSLFPELEDRPQGQQRLVERLLSCSTTGELATALEEDLRHRFALEGAALLVRVGDHLAHPRNALRRLRADTHLAALLGKRATLEIDLEDFASPLRELPDEERHWLVDSGASLLIPMRKGNTELLACLLLREREIDLPFLPRERELLSSLAEAAALALELVLSRQRAATEGATATIPPAELQPARECPHCGRVRPPPAELCHPCHRRLEELPLPHLLPGRLRIEQRIGTGRMGVIYRASDLALGRPLAVKTLPRLSPEDALRLRREARTAAAVSHPHLEVIYGVETWRGTPMILIELLEGGSLAARLRRQGATGLVETLALGVGLAGALEHLHRRGILHRDVKPGNIAYSGAGVPKLVDFDLARLAHDPRSDSWEAVPSRGGGHRSESSSSSQPSLRRTDWLESLYYRSPETVAGEPPSQSSDLWSLHAVLFECIAGRRLFLAQRLPEILREVREAPIPSLDELVPGPPRALVEHFRKALHRDPRRRLGSAREVYLALTKLRADLGGSEPVRRDPPSP